MEKVMCIECPAELLLGLHVNVERLAEMVKLEAAIALFRKGSISSGMAARWLDMPRAAFLFKAMEQGAALLEDSSDDFRRETPCCCDCLLQHHAVHRPVVHWST